MRIPRQRGPAAFILVGVLMSGASTQGGPTGDQARLLSAPAGAEVVKDRYIVVLKSGVRTDLAGRTRARGVDVRHEYTAVLRGFSATMDTAELADVRRDAAVAYVEPVLVERGDGDQSSPPWGLDRIDQRTGMNSHFVFKATGHGVRVYVTDTGIRRTHQEFAGRLVAGYDFVDDDSDPSDCHGHGTHVAGTAAGRTSGVAKEATVVAVRVLNCDNRGATDDGIAAIDWVRLNHPGGPAVLNRSVGVDGGVSVALEAAVGNLMSQRNILVVAAAGNDNQDACQLSPGRMGQVLTVGATDGTDRRADFSNWGGCVDLFAPGYGISSAWHTGDTHTNTRNGTSMAAPHVAGMAALYLQTHPTATPAQVHAALVDTSTKNVVTDPRGTPNRLLYHEPHLPSPYAPLNAMFAAYGDNAGCADWSGADATQSIRLPSGKRAWFFADSFLNRPSERAGFHRSALRNSIVMQDGGNLRTITGGNTCRESDPSLPFWDRYAKTPFAEGTNAFYWPGDAMVVGANVVKFFYRNEPQPPWWTDTHSAVASIPISTLENNSVINSQPTLIPPRYTYGTHPINWGLALLQVGSVVYIYGAGIVDNQNNRKAYLASAAPGDLTDPARWQFYAGGSWSAMGDQNAAVPVSSGFHVENGFSVAHINGRYWLVQHEPNLNGGRIMAHPADSPWGFTNERVALYNPPEGGRGPTNRYLFYYEARLHHDLAAPGRVILTYNVNSSAVSVGCRSLNDHDGSVYRPRFVEVPLGRFDALEASTSPPYSAPNAAPLAADLTWYDQWAEPQEANGGCPPLTQPTTLTAAANPDGSVALNWSDYGRDMWYWVESRDVTAGGAWTRPALWQSGTSMVDLPLLDPAKQGHTIEWRVIPFANGSSSREAPASNVVQRVVRCEPPAQVTGVVATRVDSGRIELTWNEVTYPAPSVYYAVDYWNISQGQTEAQATRWGFVNPGTTRVTLNLPPGDMVGFRVTAQNIGGYGPASVPAVATA
ncbi:S8 family serine peptidase [Virgisporangium aliadipatigenens]|nr:S8 family serine peptidase [Virgisporangium aliadipatigenens]